MIKLGKLNIEGAALAPMAGFTDSAFRRVCSSFGAGLSVSEMISAKALCFGDKKTARLISFHQSERPYALQLFGNEPDCMAQAAAMLMEHKPDLIDINMGCPVPKIAGSGCGSALLKTPKLAGEIVSAVCKKVSVPVSVKIRIGWDEEHICGAEFARRLEDSGAALITVHGRTRQQMYLPSVNLDAIAAVKAAVSVPVIANGDVASLQDAEKMLSYTGCDLVMVGRAALGNPFIFRELKAAATGQAIPAPPSFYERMDNLRSFCDLEIESKGERLAMMELRRHLPFFFKGMRGAAEIRRRCCCVENKHELSEIIRDALLIQNQTMEE